MRAFKLRSALVLVILALIASLPVTARQAPRPATNDFLVRAAPSRIDALALRNGLQVIRTVVATPDPQGRSVYLLRAPQGLAASPQTEESLAADPDVADVEPAILASLPETYQGLHLTQSTQAILGAVLQASRLVPPGGVIDSYWLGPVTDRQIANNATAQLTFTFKNPPNSNPAGYGLTLGVAETVPAAAVRQAFVEASNGTVRF
jgi:hypothetical protein